MHVLALTGMVCAAMCMQLVSAEWDPIILKSKIPSCEKLFGYPNCLRSTECMYLCTVCMCLPEAVERALRTVWPTGILKNSIVCMFLTYVVGTPHPHCCQGVRFGDEGEWEELMRYYGQTAAASSGGIQGKEQLSSKAKFIIEKFEEMKKMIGL